MENNELCLYDRNLIPINIGDKIRIKHCVGIYGKTRMDEGILLKIDQYGGFFMLDAKTKLEQYITVNKTRHTSMMVCDHVHNHYEHGHTTWVEVIEKFKPKPPRMK